MGRQNGCSHTPKWAFPEFKQSMELTLHYCWICNSGLARIDARQAFVAVADLRGFAPAARKLGQSPSGITRLIAALEERLGARLLQRTTRQVTLTDAGSRYLERARRILADIEEAEGSVEGERTRPGGRLVVSAPIGFGRLHVSPVMSAYLKRSPDVSADLRLSE